MRGFVSTIPFGAPVAQPTTEKDGQKQDYSSNDTHLVKNMALLWHLAGTRILGECDLVLNPFFEMPRTRAVGANSQICSK